VAGAGALVAVVAARFVIGPCRLLLPDTTVRVRDPAAGQLECARACF